jgi:hypothetical protein
MMVGKVNNIPQNMGPYEKFALQQKLLLRM